LGKTGLNLFSVHYYMKQSETSLGEKEEKGEPKYYCECCDYSCSVKFSYDRHMLTSKHIKQCQLAQNETNETKVETKKEKNEKKENTLSAANICGCGQVCNSRTTLWRHKKKCNIIEHCSEPHALANSTTNKDELITYLMKENQEFKNLILEIVKKDTYNQSTNNNNTTNNTTNSHNKAFNLNFFLNETCKDAMNIMDFVDSIKLQLSDLEKVGELGYVEGISNIIVKNLNELDVTQRPVHCTDKKRETMYIRDEDKWEKDESNSKIKKAIKRVASKNQRLLPKFKEAHPDCGTYHSKYSDQYNKIIIESVGGSGDNDAEKEEKIIRNISKNVVVEK
jgi:hypothetical protein